MFAEHRASSADGGTPQNPTADSAWAAAFAVYLQVRRISVIFAFADCIFFKSYMIPVYEVRKPFANRFRQSMQLFTCKPVAQLIGTNFCGKQYFVRIDIANACYHALVHQHFFNRLFPFAQLCLQIFCRQYRGKRLEAKFMNATDCIFFAVSE